jgi:hypothetical protein
MTTIDTTPAQTDIVHPRGIQHSYVLNLSSSLAGRTITWVVKTACTIDGVPVPDSEALLVKDNATIGGVVVDVTGLTATLTLYSGDCDDPVKFPEGRVRWYGFKTDTDEPLIGTFRVITPP